MQMGVHGRGNAECAALGRGGGRERERARAGVVDLNRLERHDEDCNFNVRRILHFCGINDIKHRCVLCVCRQRALPPCLDAVR